MASDLDRHILVITEPTLKLDPMVYDSGAEEDPSGKKISKENGGLTPAVRINGIDLQQNDINTLSINMSEFIPELSLAFMDSNNFFKGDSIPRDGDVVSIRIASRQSDVFKDIRMDFDIIRCSADAAPEGGQNPQSLPGGEYRISGRLRVPKLYAEESKGYGKKTSLDHLEAIATELKLGFATNIDKTDDEMSRFCPYIPKSKFISDIVKHGYIDDESFVVCKIDPYYHLNYVDLNKVFNSKNDLELSYFSKMQENFNKNPEDDDKANKIKGPLLITNHPEYQDSPQFFESFRVINESGEKTAEMGYKIKMQYFENDSDEGLVSFDIESMASKKMSDIEEPLRGRRTEGSGKEEENRYKDEVKQKYVGRIDADKTHGNMNINHYFAAIQNKMNYNESTKIKMEVTLDQINPSIYAYMKIPVFVVAYNDTEVARLKSLKESKKEKGFATVGEEYGEDPNSLAGDKIAMDEFHTGYYIVEDIKYIYDSDNGEGIQQKITLLRREWPSKLNTITAESMAAQSPPAPPAPPAPAPPAPAPPAPAPPAPAPPKDVPLEVEVTMTGGNITQDAWSPFMGQNTFVILNGTWKANREEVMFDNAYAYVDQVAGLMDSFKITTSNGLRIKKDGTIIIDMYQEGGIMDEGKYTVQVTLEAEGKKFKIKPNGVVPFTVVDAPRPPQQP